MTTRNYGPHIQMEVHKNRRLVIKNKLRFALFAAAAVLIAAAVILPLLLLGGSQPQAPLPPATQVPQSPSPSPVLPAVTPTPLPTQAPTPTPAAPAFSALDAHSIAARMPTGRCVRTIETDMNYVAITIDDGPTYGDEMMLDVFKEKGVTATFFLVGYEVERRPDLVKRMVEEGHDIGNHTDTHLRLTSVPFSEALANVKTCGDRMKAASGTDTPWVRPPYSNLTQTLNDSFNDNGYQVVMWTVDTNDWDDSVHSKSVETALTAEAGDIILIHSESTSREELTAIIDGLRAKGLEPVNLSTLLATSKNINP